MITRIVHLGIYVIIPIVGILWFGWDWRSIILLYWLENITVGLATIISMIRTPRVNSDTQGNRWQWTINGQPAQRMPKAVLVPFFILHYGLFTLVHGIFVFVLILGVFNVFFPSQLMNGMPFAYAPASGELFAFSAGGSGLDLWGIVIAWGIASVVQLTMGFFTPRESLPPAQTLFFSPYKRIIALHLTVIFGAGLIIWFGWPPVSAILLVLLHVLTDLPALLKKP